MLGCSLTKVSAFMISDLSILRLLLDFVGVLILVISEACMDDIAESSTSFLISVLEEECSAILTNCPSCWEALCESRRLLLADFIP